jgi:hypothetical protein
MRPSFAPHNVSFSLHIIVEEVHVHFALIIFNVAPSVWDVNIYGHQLLVFYYLSSDYLSQQS